MEIQRVLTISKTGSYVAHENGQKIYSFTVWTDYTGELRTEGDNTDDPDTGNSMNIPTLIERLSQDLKGTLEFYLLP